jgi:excisionase family DNA binding protein
MRNVCNRNQAAPMLGLQSPPVVSTAHCSLTDVNTPTGFDPASELLTIAEVAKLFKISVSSVRRLQQQRRIPFIKIGGSVRFVRDDIVSYVERERVESIG